MIRSKKITQSARDEVCTMGSPMCNGNSETVVWCHSNALEHGKGVGHKAHDIMGFYGCSGCHQFFDIESRTWNRDDRMLYFYRAHAKSLIRLIEKGIVKIA